MALSTFHASGADEVVVDVDVERGIVLALESRFGGKTMSRTAMDSVAFDEPLDDEVFLFDPPDGGPVRSLEELRPATQRVSVHEAQRHTSFDVLLLRDVPAGWRLTVDHCAGHPDYVRMSYEREDASATLFLLQGPAAAKAPFLEPGGHPDPCQTVRRGDHVFQVRDAGGPGQQGQLYGCIGDTRIAMASAGFTAGQLVSAALDLVSAPSEDPGSDFT